MSEVSEAIQAKCLAFSDRIIKLNDFLLEQAAIANAEKQKAMLHRKGTSSILHHPSSISAAPVPVYLQAVSNLCNQLLRAGTSIGANNAEATNAVSKTDYRSKSYIALKEARESLYWIELLRRNGYLNETQYQSLYNDCEELVKILVHRCKKIDEQLKDDKK